MIRVAYRHPDETTDWEFEFENGERLVTRRCSDGSLRILRSVVAPVPARRGLDYEAEPLAALARRAVR